MNKTRTKIMDLKTAVASHVTDGCTLSLGGAIAREPVAVAREIVQQGKQDLTLTGTAKTTAGEILVGAGCIKRLELAYLWIGVIGQGRNFRRAMEEGIPRRPELEEYSMFSAALRVLAGSIGVPFLPVKSLMGSDLPKVNDRIKRIEDPYSGEPIHVVPAVNPDVAFIHVQRSDPSGNAVILGNLWNDPTLARAARKTIITCEEIVEEKEIRKNPTMTAIPHYCVSGVVHLPYGAHPEPVDGYYWMDQPFRKAFADKSKTREGFLAWLDEWVYGCPTHQIYMEKLGQKRFDSLCRLERRFREGMDA
ncbi:MAG: CoA transferase subunit A [Deltaproteobacteria bacterium]|nr:CoA transferase subunit A [Deltaproteobacteria bacterium]MBW1922682.1 CoA transferase subunit A [Deltaproteobacteria bacterium]MBW2007653.1 CoA transferase subunit A [Deltaproteobacteria bacterium]RLB31693.1 MAG: CoA transferase subunit A [Deltaproteobacteria bacterium]